MKKLIILAVLGLMANLNLYSQSYSLKLVTESSLGKIPRKSEIVVEEIIRHATADESGMSNPVKFNCTKWVDKADAFELPSDVTFQEMAY